MCGIAGIFHFSKTDPVNRDVLEKMNACLIHRGPDDAGVHVDAKAGLAMRRLAIIDVASGHQPLSSDDETVWIVFNGEIYNFQELRDRLLKKGHRFKTHSDTEVILRLYLERGVDCVRDLRGMFAFAIWDKNNDRLLLARDRVGKKPLLYSLADGRLSWASEMQALLKAPWISRDIDPQAIDLYLGLQYIPSPSTIYTSVKKLPPAHRLVIEKGAVRIDRYWKLPTKPSSTILSFEDAKRAVREKFQEAVRLRMISEVPLGAFLSGGIDSTLVVGMMSSLSSQPIKTFAIGFEEQEFSELPYAREAAARFKTDHTEFIVKPDMTDVLPKLAVHYGEPYGDSSALPSYYLARETAKHVTVALTGDGGDENAAGYKRYAAMKAMRCLDVVPSPLRRAAAPLGRLFTGKARRLIEDVWPASTAGRYENVIGIFNEREKQSLYAPEFSARLGRLSRSRDYLEQFFDEARDLDFVNQMLYVDFESYLPECLMAKVDIASMANSLEARAPLLDHEFIELMFSFPGDWKLKGFRSSKWILKEALKDLLPPAIERRSKMGFGIPLPDWFRGELKAVWRDRVLSPAALSRGYFQKNALERLFDEHQSGRRDNGYRMWVLLMLEIWHMEMGG